MTATTKSQRLPNIPPALQSYPVFFDRLNGACGRLTGQVDLTMIFTDIPGCAWTEEARAAARAAHRASLDRIVADARSYGIRLNIRPHYQNARVEEAVTMQNGNAWAAKVLASAGLPPFDRACVELERQYGADSAPLCFCINDPGRSYAHHGGGQDSTEYMVLFDSEALFHELCHLFGATDFYYPEKLSDLAKKYYPDSIMQGSGSHRRVDGFTAYLIGWIDMPSPLEQKFLAGLEKIPLEAFKQAGEIECFTGEAREMRTRSGVYTGYMVDGLPEGRGKYYYHNGNIYEGEYRAGSFHGYGRFLGADGTNYHGEFRQGKKHGQGVMHWAGGDRYVGQYEDDERHGRGEYRFENGDLYTGDFLKGGRTGRGTMTFADGSRYEGGFLEGSFHGHGRMEWASGEQYAGEYDQGQRQGHGTYTWADGSAYTGDFRANARTGQGTILWPDQSSYTGDFLDGTFHGEGRRVFRDGVVYLGSYVRGLFHGQGEMIWPGGARYKGDFREGERTGQGTYTWTTGAVYTGGFRKGELHGSGKYTSPDGSTRTGTWKNGTYIG